MASTTGGSSSRRFYERLFWLLTAALAAVSIGVFTAGTEVSREATPPAAATDRSA